MKMDVELTVFDADLKGLTLLLGIPLQQGIAKFAIDTLATVTVETPKDTGRAAASWTLAEVQPDLSVQPPGEYPAYKSDPEGAARQAVAGIGSASRSEEYFIANGLPYIQRLNDGYSQQAPAGFVERAIAVQEAEVTTLIEQILQGQ